MESRIDNPPEMIKQHLQKSGFEVVEIWPVSEENGRPASIQLPESQPNIQNEQEFWVRIKSRVQPIQTPLKAICEEGSARSLGGIYLPNGKLNIPFLFKNAELLKSSKEYSLARKIYGTILRTGEYTAVVLQRIGMCLEGEGKIEEACIKYEESIAYQPTVEVYRLWAGALTKLNKKKQAAEVMELGMRLKTPSVQQHLTSRSRIIKAGTQRRASSS